MDLTTVPLISADCHVDEPHDLWYDRLPAALRDLAPRRIETNEEGGWELVLNGQPLGWKSMSADDAKAKDDERIAQASADHRLAVMDKDGVRAEIIFPTIGLYVWNITDKRVGEASCVIYNDWIHERLGGVTDRIRCAGIIPTWDVDAAIAEIGRVAGLGFASVLLPLVGTPEWNHPQWERMWDAIAETGLPVSMHQGSGHNMLFYRGWGAPTANLLATQSMAPRAAALLSCSGVLERHPDTHFVFVEVNAGWVAWTMKTLDEYYEAHRGWSKPKLAEMPSVSIKRQIHATFQDDVVALNNRHYTGLDVLMWGSDYPHPESTYPHSHETVERLFRGLDIDEAAAILGGNAARIFGFDQSLLAAA